MTSSSPERRSCCSPRPSRHGRDRALLAMMEEADEPDASDRPPWQVHVEDQIWERSQSDATHHVTARLPFDRVGLGKVFDALARLADRRQQPLEPTGTGMGGQVVDLMLVVGQEGGPEDDPGQLTRGPLPSLGRARQTGAVRRREARPRDGAAVARSDRFGFDDRLLELPLPRAAELLEIAYGTKLVGHQATYGGGRWQGPLAREALDLVPELRREGEAPRWRESPPRPGCRSGHHAPQCSGIRYRSSWAGTQTPRRPAARHTPAPGCESQLKAPS